jgi:hypothetical protein
VENEHEMVVSRQRFRFDRVFSEETSQEAVFQNMAAPLVDSVCEGVNCALFAYGVRFLNLYDVYRHVLSGSGMCFVVLY